MPNENIRIMLVEDEDVIRILTRRALGAAGYQVEDYAHGESALTKLQELRATGKEGYFSVILSDIDMPKLDGLALAEECKHLAPESALILMTGKPRDTYPDNVCTVLDKPFTSATLYEAIERCTPPVPETQSGLKDQTPIRSVLHNGRASELVRPAYQLRDIRTASQEYKG